MTYKLPHDLDRLGQSEALQWILESDKKYLILCAPTGFGKSALAAGASIDGTTMALVLHKSLQSANYRDQYKFDILYGKSNYPCFYPPKSKIERNTRYTAFDCPNPAGGHNTCYCPYQEQVEVCMKSQRISLNYAKFLVSGLFLEYCDLKYLFLDEAHNLPDIVTNFTGFTINWNNPFLQCNGRIKPDHLLVNSDSAVLRFDEAMVIFKNCARAIGAAEPDQDLDLPNWRKWKRLHQKVDITNKILAASSLDDWYYGVDQKGLTIKPLTAKYHFKSQFDKAEKIIMMSATISPNIASRLGIEPDEFDYMTIPSPWPIPTRLVYDLGGPALNWQSTESDKNTHAQLIASVLKPDKSGIIHTASKYQAKELSGRLADICPELDFIISTDGIGTDNQLQEWYGYRKPGVYCVTWAFHEGVDLGGDDISIMAKTPYPGLGSGYEKTKKDYDTQWYLEKTAYAVQQVCGRSRRGLPEHYMPGNKMVYIADSAWHRLSSLMLPDFRKSIRRYNGHTR